MTAPDSAEEIFGRRMRRRRDELGISTRAFAERMRAQGFEWHHTTVQRTESAKRPVRLNEAASIAAILNSDLEKLLQPEADPAVIAALEREYDTYVAESIRLSRALKRLREEEAEHEVRAQEMIELVVQSRRGVEQLTTELRAVDDRVREIRMRLGATRKDPGANER